MKFQAADAATLMPFHAAATILRNVSDFLYARTIAAMSSTMIAMVAPIGLASMATLSPHMARVHRLLAIAAARCATAHAAVAAVASFVSPANVFVTNPAIVV